MKLFKSFKRKKKYNRVGPKMYWSYSKRKDRKRLKNLIVL